MVIDSWSGPGQYLQIVTYISYTHVTYYNDIICVHVQVNKFHLLHIYGDYWVRCDG